MLSIADRGLSEEQRMMRDTCRAFVDDFVAPFVRESWQREWSMTPEERLPSSILEQADRIGVRTLGIPEAFGGTPIDARDEVQTFAIIAEEIARGDSGLAESRDRRRSGETMPPAGGAASATATTRSSSSFTRARIRASACFRARRAFSCRGRLPA